MSHIIRHSNNSTKDIIIGMILAAVSLFVNGLGVYLTIHASIGAGPWDVLSLGVSKTFGVLYGTASITISFTILFIDLWLREPIGLAMIIDSLVVGKAVDFFNAIDVVPVPKSLLGGVLMVLVGLTIMAYTEYFYMSAALGCGPRDALLVGLKRRLRRIPIGAVAILMLSCATLVGFLLGGPVGIGTLICAFCMGPILQFCFFTVGFDATHIHHQPIGDSLKIFSGKK